MNFNRIFNIIVGECRNSCIDERSTDDYFLRLTKNIEAQSPELQVLLREIIENFPAFFAFVGSLNFAAIRENDELLYDKLLK